MSKKEPTPYGGESDEEWMHTASATETTGSVPTPPVSDFSAESYSEIVEIPDINGAGLPLTETVDPKTCVGCGTCESMCPQIFHLAGDGLAHADLHPVPPTMRAEAEAARFACPVGAIHSENSGIQG